MDGPFQKWQKINFCTRKKFKTTQIGVERVENLSNRVESSWQILGSSRVELKINCRNFQSSRVELLFFNFESSFEFLFLGNFLMIFKSGAFNMQRYWVTWKKNHQNLWKIRNDKEKGYIFHFIGSEFRNELSFSK